MTGRCAIADIHVGARHRKDLGDLSALAESIRSEGLLQPVGVTADGDLVFGERRIAACRDILGWTEIETRTVPVSSIAAGEYAENEMRKDFTPSERVAILQTIERMKKGRPEKNLPRVESFQSAARSVGFSKSTASNAQAVVARGVPELVEAMDRGAIGIRPAAEIARLPAAEQRKVIALRAAERVNPPPRRRERKGRKITIPWSAVPAARILAERWPASLCRDLIEALQQRLADREAA